jgi:hypothetical protein
VVVVADEPSGFVAVVVVVEPEWLAHGTSVAWRSYSGLFWSFCVFCGVVVAPGVAAVAPVVLVAVDPVLGLFTSAAGFVAVVPVVPACGVVVVPVCAGCVLTALGLVVPLPSCEFVPVALGDSAGVWLVTGVFAIEPFSGVCVVAGEVADGLPVCDPIPLLSLAPGC